MVGALPPPTHGIAVEIDRIIRSAALAKQFRIVHVDISDRRDLSNVGRLDWRNLWLAIRHWWQVAITLARYRPDLIHVPLAQNYLGLLRDWTFLLAALATPGTSIIGQVAGGGFGEFLQSCSPWFRRFVLPAIRHCSALIVASEWHRDRVAKVVRGTPVIVVRRGTEWIDGAAPATKQGAPLSVLFANSVLTEAKGVFDALAAAVICDRRGIESRWTFVGEFVSRADAARAREIVRGIDSVRLLGAVEREVLLRHYQAADVFVFPPSAQEAFGLVRIEAMAAGLPVITTAAGGATEVIVDGHEGFIVGYRNPEQIADRVEMLAGDPELRARMSTRARERQRSSFSLEAFEDALGEAWRSVVR